MSRFQLLKLLAPGFLPLLVFLAADALWGTRVGLATAVAFGLAELALSYAREKTWDRFVLLDTLLITAMGGISLLLDNDLFFRLKPAVIELVFCLILGISVFTPANLLQGMLRRYLKGLELGPEQVRAMTRSMRALFYLFLAHAALTAYAAFALSRAAWGFISGGLFNILFAAFFLVELWRGRRARPRFAAAPGEEWFDLVDAEGRVIGRAPRSACHSQKGLLHPVVHLHLIDDRDRLFLQKRSPAKEIQPGRWDTAVGGHARCGETIAQALAREAIEETGLADIKAAPLARYVWQSEVESELVFLFAARTGRQPRIDPTESTEGRFWKIAQVRQALGKGILTPNFEFEFPILMKMVFGEKIQGVNETNS